MAEPTSSDNFHLGDFVIWVAIQGESCGCLLNFEGIHSSWTRIIRLDLCVNSSKSYPLTRGSPPTLLWTMTTLPKARMAAIFNPRNFSTGFMSINSKAFLLICVMTFHFFDCSTIVDCLSVQLWDWEIYDDRKRAETGWKIKRRDRLLDGEKEIWLRRRRTQAWSDGSKWRCSG